jgi:TPR repeat protein
LFPSRRRRSSRSAWELRRANDAVVAQSTLWLAVSAPPARSGASPDEAILKEWVRKGDEALRDGNVAAARALYEWAAAKGSAEAALAMGATYDQHRLWALGLFGLMADRDQALRWYRRAGELGHPEANARISALPDP